jgi:HK97 family phage major capsid protein
VGAIAATAETRMFYRRLRPNSHELAVQVVIRNRLVTSIVDHPEVAWALKQEIAYALACQADAGFLHGDPGPPHKPSRIPRGITHTGKAETQEDAEADLLVAARAMVSKLRRTKRVRFGDAGWVLHPSTLDALTEIVTRDGQQKKRGRVVGQSLDAIGSGQLLAHDGMDGGVLLGYPFVVSEAAADDPAADARQSRMYFSSDWSAAWVGASSPLVEVDFSGDIRFERDETVVRAIMHHDFALSRPELFIYTDPIGDPAD